MALRLSLRQRLFLLTSAALLPTLAVLATVQVNVRSSREMEVRDLAIRSATLAALELERILEGVESVMRVIGRAPVVREARGEECSAFLRDILADLPQLSGLVVTDPGGNLVCNARDATPANLAGRPYIAAALEDDDIVVSEYTIDRLTSRKVVPLALAVRADDRPPTGVIVAAIDLEWLGQRLRDRRLPPGGSLTVADRNGVIISREPFPERFVGTRIPADFLPLVSAAEPGTRDVTSQDGTRRVLGYVPVSPKLPLYVSAGLSSEASYQDVENATRVSFWVALSGALLALGAAWIVGEYTFRRPIQALSGTLQKWRAGKTTTRTGADPSTGEIGLLGKALDEMMDEIAARQQERELLQRELDHRIKNTLATVQAIAHSTFNTPERGKAVIPEFTARLVALGKAHDVLTREQWEGAKLADLASRVLEPVAGRAVERCDMAGPPVLLSPRQVLALTMILHELATNALKYGALGVEEGRVRLTWSVGDEGGREVLTLVWKEIDGPPVLPPTRSGFGSRLIQRGFGRELGEVKLAFEPDGVRCELRIALAGEQPAEAQPALS